MTELDISFIMRFLLNLTAIVLLTYACYFRIHRNSTIAGSFILFGVGIFTITYFLHGVDMSMEFAFGLFAVFTMLRYRTESISIKEMTYLFLVTAIALITSVGLMPMVQLAAINGTICLVAFVVDGNIFKSKTATQSICYEKIENITPQNRDKLLTDLRQRTGLNIKQVYIEQIDFLRDTALITVVYLPDALNAVEPLKQTSQLPQRSQPVVEKSANVQSVVR